MSHFQCHISAIPIYSCMRQRTTKQFTLATSSAITICAAVYTVAGIFGYLTFGSNVEDDILSNYSATEPLVMVALIAMAAKTFTSYPILLFCGRFESLYPCLLLFSFVLREGLDSLLKDLVLSEESAERWEKVRWVMICHEHHGDWSIILSIILGSYWDHNVYYPICQVRRVVIATTWFLLTVILAIQIPNISMVIIVINMSRTHQRELHNYLGNQHARQSSRCLHIRLPWCLSPADYPWKVFCIIFGQLFPFCNDKQFYPCSSDPDMVTRSSRVRIAGAITFILAGTFLFGVVLTQVKRLNSLFLLWY